MVANAGVYSLRDGCQVLWKSAISGLTFDIMLMFNAGGYSHHHSLFDTFVNAAMWRWGSIAMSAVVHQLPVLVPVGIGVLVVAVGARGLRWLRHRA